MRNTKKLCKRDFLETYRLLVSDQKNLERSTHNYRYQLKFGTGNYQTTEDEEYT
jgi:hypothetical protein